MSKVSSTYSSILVAIGAFDLPNTAMHSEGYSIILKIICTYVYSFSFNWTYYLWLILRCFYIFEMFKVCKNEIDYGNSSQWILT